MTKLIETSLLRARDPATRCRGWGCRTARHRPRAFGNPRILATPPTRL